MLPKKEAGGREGPFRIANQPAFREPLNAIALPGVSILTVLASNQVGKTMMQMIAALYWMDEDPGRLLWVASVEGIVDGIVDQRLKSIIEASPELRRYLQKAVKWTKEVVDLGAMEIRKGYSGSVASLQSWPSQKVIADELSTWRVDPTHHPLRSVHNRTIAQIDLKILESSTPDTELDLICEQYAASDKRKYHVPCVHCGKRQELVFSEKTLRWPKGMSGPEIRSSGAAAYYCIHCETPWSSTDRLKSLRSGVWVPEGCGVDDASGKVIGEPTVLHHRGYQMSALCSTWVTPSRMAAEFLLARDQNNLKSFYNFWLGLPWQDLDKSPEATMVGRCAGDYDQGEIPAEAEVLTMGIDVQKVELYYELRAWGYKSKQWMITAGVLTDWESLEGVLRATWKRKDGRELRIVRGALIDWGGGGEQGERTDEVADFCRRNVEFVRPCRGRGTIPNQAFRIMRPQRSGRNTKISLSGIPELVEVNTDMMKTRIMRLIADEGAGEWFVPRDVHEEYCRQITSEQKVYKRSIGGQTKVRWETKAGQPQNHWLDCAVYATAAGEALGLPARFRGPPPVSSPPPTVKRNPIDDIPDDWAGDIADDW